MEYNKFTITLGKIWYYSPIVLSVLICLCGICQLLLGTIYIWGPVFGYETIPTTIDKCIPYLPASIAPQTEWLGQTSFSLLCIILGGYWSYINIQCMISICDPDDLETYCKSSIWYIFLGLIVVGIIFNGSVYLMVIKGLSWVVKILLGLVVLKYIFYCMQEEKPKEIVAIIYKE